MAVACLFSLPATAELASSTLGEIMRETERGGGGKDVLCVRERVIKRKNEIQEGLREDKRLRE